VSLLNRVKRAGLNRHLDDDEFTRIWSASLEGGEPPTDAHLAACAQCRSRYAGFVAWLDRVRDDARAEADEAFAPERLAAQQAQVLRRLETLERPARIIAFPKFSRPATSTRVNAQRWVAAAAAAGLVIGVTAGQFVNLRDALSGRPSPQEAPQSARASQMPLATSPTVTPISASSVSDEALFFGDGVPRAPYDPLKPMDDITPRARDLEYPR
jgi:hypothetical protein